MLLASMHTADLGERHRELLRLGSMDPDTTAILYRSVRDETVVGVVAGIAIAVAGGVMVRHYPHLPGLVYAKLGPSNAMRGAPRVPLIGGNQATAGPRSSSSPVRTSGGRRRQSSSMTGFSLLPRAR